jgi:amino acid adenylation domain-containing protein
MATTSNDPTRTDTTEEPPCIHQSFHAQARLTPDAECLIRSRHDGDSQELSSSSSSLTYSQVQRRVLSLASDLRAQGADVETVVATYMEPSVDYVIGLLAILSAGAAYVPMELAYPTPMLQKVLQDSCPVVIITTIAEKTRLPLTDAAVLAIDDNEHDSHQVTELEELWEMYQTWLPHPSLDNLAFVVYSSGTTGQPKGIANPHRAPALSYQWRFDTIRDYQPGDVVACHVFFVWECLRPIMRGGAVLPVPPSIVFDGEQLSQLLQQQAVTEMLFTPSLLENMMNTLEESVLRDRLATMSTIFLNGEVVSMALRQRCLTLLPHIRFVNLYSISECHEVGAIDLLDIDASISTKYCTVGIPCSLSPIYILDETTGLPVDASNDEAGELYVGGDMLAREYLNLPELTASRFVDNTFSGSGKMYRTGDRARLLRNGQLEILGRCDFMVKIRGYSIVLGAVEAALVETISLQSCVVVADGEEGTCTRENKNNV